jgi:hypothetical protein
LGGKAGLAVSGVQRVTVYIDGFNLYYALLKPNPAVRWMRQRLYLKALETLPDVTVEFGHFAAHQVRMALVTPPARGPRTALVWKTEEKGSDVNIATRLLLDG